MEMKHTTKESLSVTSSNPIEHVGPDTTTEVPVGDAANEETYPAGAPSSLDEVRKYLEKSTAEKNADLFAQLCADHDEAHDLLTQFYTREGMTDLGEQAGLPAPHELEAYLARPLIAHLGEDWRQYGEDIEPNEQLRTRALRLAENGMRALKDAVARILGEMD